jgi:uncharacterized protein with HEPN domain
MLNPDIVRLQHMVDAANEALSFIADKSKSEVETDRALALALVKLIEIVGEAASKISRELRSQSPEIPWVDIVAMRNRLIHSYFDVNLDIVWQTVTEELPPVVRQNTSSFLLTTFNDRTTLCIPL